MQRNGPLTSTITISAIALAALMSKMRVVRTRARAQCQAERLRLYVMNKLSPALSSPSGFSIPYRDAAGPNASECTVSDVRACSAK